MLGLALLPRENMTVIGEVLKELGLALKEDGSNQ
jgi:hypothetical protein